MKHTPVVESFDGGQPVSPNYELGDEALQAIEQQMVQDAKALADDMIVAAWVDPRHEFSNLLRTREAQKFPEVDVIDDYYETHQKYIALIDTRGEGGVVHAATIMEYDPNNNDPEHDRTGFYTIDSLIELGNFTKAEFLTYYKGLGVDLGSTVSIETNFKIRDDTELFFDLGTADLTYLTLFNMMIRKDAPREGTVAFASINALQAKSLDRNGIKYSPLLGRTDFHTEEADLGKVSNPVAIDYASAYDVLSVIDFKLPELTYEVGTSEPVPASAA